MKSKLLVASAMVLGASVASAEQYVCVVNCVSPSGEARLVVTAGSASAAAKVFDRQSDQACRSAGYGRSTVASMSASQCSRQ